MWPSTLSSGSTSDIMYCIIIAGVSGIIITKPESISVNIGSDITLFCQSDDHTPVNWQLRRFQFNQTELISDNGSIVTEDIDKFAIDVNRTTKLQWYDLVMRNVDPNDAGHAIDVNRTTKLQWYNLVMGNVDPNDVGHAIDVNRTTKPQSYDLVIRNVDPNDAGEYTCIERAGLGDTASAKLTVVSGKHTF